MRFPFSTMALLCGRQEGHPWWLGGDDLTGVCLISPVVTITSVILAPIKSRTVAFWHWLTQAVLENGR